MKFSATTPLLFAAGLTVPLSLAGQGLGDTLFAVGTTYVDNNNEDWAYLVWSAQDLTLLQDRTIAVYAKSGDANSGNPYEYQGLVRPRVNPIIIETLLNRGAGMDDYLISLGADPILTDNIELIEKNVDDLFADLMPIADLTLGEKLSVVIQGASSDPALFQNLFFLAKVHPPVNLVIGSGYTQKIDSGMTTFELRECPAGPPGNADTECQNVVARITVEAGNPRVLPAPGAPQEVPGTLLTASGYNPSEIMADLNVRLRWSEPNNLRRLSLLQFGFNVYRVDPALAQAENWDISPPGPGELLEFSYLAPNAVQRVNNVPIVTEKALTAAEAADTPLVDPINPFEPNLFFVLDDNDRFRGGAGYKNGDERYFFVTARDILGRDGESSPGSLILICDQFPPDAPEDIQVTNVWEYDTNTNTGEQHLKVRWKQSSSEDATSYYVYRWETAQEHQTNSANPYDPNFLIAGPIAHNPNVEYLEYVDKGPGSPSVAVNAGETFWYTVRTADDGACGENVGPNSRPDFGVPRDRVGPPRPTGGVNGWCVRIDVDPLRSRVIDNDDRVTRRDGRIPIRFVGLRDDDEQAIEWAEFFIGTEGSSPSNPSTFTQVGKVYFPAGQNQAVLDTRVIPPTGQQNFFVMGCRMGLSNGEVSPIRTLFIEGADPNTKYEASFDGFILRSLERNSRRCGGTHTVVDPVTGAINGIEIEIGLQPGTEEWKLYRRIDGGTLTLIRQGLDSFVDTIVVAITDAAMPVNAAEVCYFAQLFDEHGNPSPLVLLGCLGTTAKQPPPTPLLGLPDAIGDVSQPRAQIPWFSPPHGVERFFVYAAKAGPAPTDDISPELTQEGAVLVDYIDTSDFKPYQTGRVGGNFGVPGSAAFTVTIDVEPDVEYVFFLRAVNEFGQSSEDSNVVMFTWKPENTVAGPNVPWPARALPGVGAANSFNPDLQAEYVVTALFQGPAVRVGEAALLSQDGSPVQPPTDDVSFHILPADPDSGVNFPIDSFLYQNDKGETALPLVLYRYQVPTPLFPNVSGDVYQVSPLMERFALDNPKVINTGSGPVFATPVVDPFVVTWPLLQQDDDPFNYGIYIIDTQPFIRGARYVYLLVRFSELGEIVEVIQTQPVTIPL